VDGNVPRDRIALQPLQHRETRGVGQANVQQNAARLQLARESKAVDARRGMGAIEVEVVSETVEDPGEMRIVLDGEDEALSLACLAVVVDVRDGRAARRQQRWRRLRHCRAFDSYSRLRQDRLDLGDA